MLVTNAKSDVAPDDALLLLAKAHHVVPPNTSYAEACGKVVAASFEQLTMGDMCKLPHDAVCAILSSTDLAAASEDSVFDAIRAYLGASGLREAQVAAAWSTCRFAFLSCDKIAEAVHVPHIPRDALVGGFAMRIYRLERHARGGEGDSRVGALQPRAHYAKRFTYSSDFDENGILYHLGTKGGSVAWTNPADAGLITVTRSSDGYGETNAAAGRSGVDSWTSNTAGSWYIFDLGAARRVTPCHYTIRHGCSGGNHRMQNWVLEGSTDSTTWTRLKTHTNDTSIPDEGYATKSWPIDTSSRAFRYLRIRSTGGNASGYNDLMLGGFEAYGVLKGGAH